MKKIFIGSSVHRWDDTRVFLKEATSLAKRYHVELHAPAEFEYKEVNNVQIYGLPLWKNVKDRKQIRRLLLQRIKKSDFDVFHFHDPELIFVGLYVRYIKRKEVVYDIHENISKQLLNKEYIPTKLLKKIFSLSYSSIESFVQRLFKIIVAGEDILAKYKEKVVINNYPIIFSDDDLGHHAKENYLVYVGGVTDIRGVEEVAQALQIINTEQNGNRIRLRIIGEFPNQNYKKYFLDKYHNVIQFLGWKKQSEAFQLSRNCLAGVVLYLPVPNHMCLRSNKVFEYMVAALPVLYSNFPDWREQLDAFNLGLAVNPENKIDIIEKIRYIINNPEPAKEMGRNGRKMISENFNWYNEERKLFNLYDSLLCSAA